MENKKKILVFHHSGAIGGGGVAMLHILKSLKKLNCEIKVICPAEPSHMADEIKKMGLQVDEIFDHSWVFPHFNGQVYCSADPRYMKRYRHIKNSYGKVKSIIENENPDIVILNSMTISWMVECVPEKIKTICFDRETLPKNGHGKRCSLIKNWLSKMTASVYLSEYDKKNAGNDINARVICDKTDIKRFDNLPDKVTARRTLGLNEDKKYILFTGGMWRVKGSHTAAGMMRHLSDDYELIFLQYTPKPCEVSAKTKLKRILGLDYEKTTLNLLKGINDRVRFFSPQSDMLNFYAACDIVIFPSALAHQAMPIYEAGAARRPIVISDFKNTKEFAKDGINVLTFKPGNTKALAKSMLELEDASLYGCLAENGYTMSKKHHDLEDLDTEIKNLIESVEES